MGRPPAGRLHEPAGDGGGEMVPRRRDPRRPMPAIRGRVVDRRLVNEPAMGAPPADDDEPAVHDAHAPPPPARRERGPRLPPVSILAIQPQAAPRPEALPGDPAHR